MVTRSKRMFFFMAQSTKFGSPAITKLESSLNSSQIIRRCSGTILVFFVLPNSNGLLPEPLSWKTYPIVTRSRHPPDFTILRMKRRTCHLPFKNTNSWEKRSQAHWKIISNFCMISNRLVRNANRKWLNLKWWSPIERKAKRTLNVKARTRPNSKLGKSKILP